MAKKPKKKKRAGTPAGAATSYTPLFGYPSSSDLNRQATDIATGAAAPVLAGLDTSKIEADAAHRTREGDIAGWTNFQQGNLDKAFSDTQSALDRWLSMSAGNDTASQANLASALRSAAAPTEQLQAQLGATKPIPDESAALASASQADRGYGTLRTNDAGAALGRLGEARSLAGIGRVQLGTAEQGRYNADLQDIEDKRAGVQQQIAGQVPDVVQQLKDFYEKRNNDLFQQYLAEQELGQKAKDQTFQQWLATQQLDIAQAGVTGSFHGQPTLEREKFLEQSQIDWANVGINRAQVEGQLAQLGKDAQDKKDKKKAEAAKARGEAIASGLEWLSGYMAPKEGEAGKSSHGDYPYNPGSPAQEPQYDQQGNAIKGTGGPATGPYQRKFAEALRGLQQYTSYSDALRILSKSTYSDWRKQARYLLARAKRRGQKGPPVKTGRNPDTSTGRFGPG